MTSQTTPPPPSELREQLRGMQTEGRHEELLDIVLRLLAQMAAQNTQLELRLQAALRQLYRKKSEKLSPEQLLLFLRQLPEAEAKEAQVETEPAAQPGPAAPEPSAEPKAKPPRVRPVRRPLPPHLRREVRVIEPRPEELSCPGCGGPRESMGFDIRETLEFRPAELFVIEERLHKCVCKRCVEGVVRGEPTQKPIEGARPGPGLLAHLIVSKYEDSQPLHRQVQQWLRQGVELSPSTVGDWVAAAIDLLEPIFKEAKRDALGRELLSMDDTPMPVLDRDHPAGIKKGRLWAYVADFDQVCFCEYTPTWAGKGPRTVLEGFNRYLQSDGYAGIDELFTGPDPPRRVGCHAHCRRKFVAALDAKDLRAAVVLELYRQLYEVEARAREDGASPEEISRRRQAHSRPVMERLHRVIRDLHGKVVPKSPLGKATTYAINQWSTLTVFLEDGRLPIDNLHVERRHRKIALGRHNYLFCGSDEGARRHAIISTVLGNCALAGVEPTAYLRDVLSKLAGSWPQARLPELMPRAWAAAKKHPEHAQAEQLAAVG